MALTTSFLLFYYKVYDSMLGDGQSLGLRSMMSIVSRNAVQSYHSPKYID